MLRFNKNNKKFKKVDMSKFLSLGIILNLAINVAFATKKREQPTEEYVFRNHLTFCNIKMKEIQKEYVRGSKCISASQKSNLIKFFRKQFPSAPKIRNVHLFSSEAYVKGLSLSLQDRNHFTALLKHGDTKDIWDEIDLTIGQQKILFDEVSWEVCLEHIQIANPYFYNFLSTLPSSPERSAFSEFVGVLLKTGATMPVYRDLVIAFCAWLSIEKPPIWDLLNFEHTINEDYVGSFLVNSSPAPKTPVQVTFACANTNGASKDTVFLDFLSQSIYEGLSPNFSAYCSFFPVSFLRVFFHEIGHLLFGAANILMVDFDFDAWLYLSDLFEVFVNPNSIQKSVKQLKKISFRQLYFFMSNMLDFSYNPLFVSLVWKKFFYSKSDVIKSLLFQGKRELWQILGFDFFCGDLYINFFSELYVSLMLGDMIRVNHLGILCNYSWDHSPDDYTSKLLQAVNLNSCLAAVHIKPKKWKALLHFFGVSPKQYQRNIDKNDIWKQMWIIPVKTLGYALKYQNAMHDAKYIEHKKLRKNKKNTWKILNDHS